MEMRRRRHIVCLSLSKLSPYMKWYGRCSEKTHHEPRPLHPRRAARRPQAPPSSPSTTTSASKASNRSPLGISRWHQSHQHLHLSCDLSSAPRVLRLKPPKPTAVPRIPDPPRRARTSLLSSRSSIVLPVPARPSTDYNGEFSFRRRSSAVRRRRDLRRRARPLPRLAAGRGRSGSSRPSPGARQRGPGLPPAVCGVGIIHRLRGAHVPPPPPTRRRRQLAHAGPCRLHAMRVGWPARVLLVRRAGSRWWRRRGCGSQRSSSSGGARPGGPECDSGCGHRDLLSKYAAGNCWAHPRRRRRWRRRRRRRERTDRGARWWGPRQDGRRSGGGTRRPHGHGGPLQRLAISSWKKRKCPLSIVKVHRRDVLTLQGFKFSMMNFDVCNNINSGLIP